MPNGLFGSLDDLTDSIKGISNISRVRAESDPAKRRALEDKFIAERLEEEKRKGVFEGTQDAIDSRNADEGLDVRGGLDPQRALDRRLREAEGGPQASAAELQQRQQQVREIVAKRNQGQPVSDDEKRLVFEVLFDALKGLSGEREKRIAQQEERLQSQAQTPV